MSMGMSQSVERHGADLSIVPGGHLGGPLELDQFPSTSFVNHALLFTLVEQLLLPRRQSDGLRHPRLLLLLHQPHVLHPRVNFLIAFSVDEAGPEGGPGGHEQLLLVGLDVDDAVLVLHQVLEVAIRVENGRDRHRRTHEAKE